MNNDIVGDLNSIGNKVIYQIWFNDCKKLMH
jgi:hypothetical protein